MKNRLILKIHPVGVAFSLPAIAQQTPPCGATKDVRILKDKPTVYVTFERFGKVANLSEQKLVEQSKSANAKEALTHRKERDHVRRSGQNALQHNNGMHPTANSVAFIR